LRGEGQGEGLFTHIPDAPPPRKAPGAALADLDKSALRPTYLRVDPVGLGCTGGVPLVGVGGAVRLADIRPAARVRRPATKLEFLLMATGTVKWFNAQKGYGFIQPTSGGPDVFVHISAVEQAGMDGLNEGQNLSYELEQGQRGRVSAVNLRAT
jgi:CspA family cold shock protein